MNRSIREPGQVRVHSCLALALSALMGLFVLGGAHVLGGRTSRSQRVEPDSHRRLGNRGIAGAGRPVVRHAVGSAIACHTARAVRLGTDRHRDGAELSGADDGPGRRADRDGRLSGGGRLHCVDGTSMEVGSESRAMGGAVADSRSGCQAGTYVAVAPAAERCRSPFHLLSGVRDDVCHGRSSVAYGDSFCTRDVGLWRGLSRTATAAIRHAVFRAAHPQPGRRVHWLGGRPRSSGPGSQCWRMPRAC